MKCWWTMPARRARRRARSRNRTGWPLTRISPSSGWYSPNRMFIKVDLPAPFSPEQGVDLAATNGELDAVIGDDAGESLDDPSHLDRWRGVVAVPDRHGRKVHMPPLPSRRQRGLGVSANRGQSNRLPGAWITRSG